MCTKITKTTFRTAALTLLLLPIFGTKLHAQTERGAEFNGCVNANYNGPYGWLQFVNNCNQTLHIVW
jgi:hypothetical protein